MSDPQPEGQALTFISWPQHCGMQCPALTIRISCLHFPQTYRSVSLGMLSPSPCRSPRLGALRPRLEPPLRTQPREPRSRTPRQGRGPARRPPDRTPGSTPPWRALLGSRAPFRLLLLWFHTHRLAPQGCWSCLTPSSSRDAKEEAPDRLEPEPRSSSPSQPPRTPIGILEAGAGRGPGPPRSASLAPRAPTRRSSPCGR